MLTRRVLVTGAGGKTGRAVVAALGRRAIATRALVRDVTHGAGLSQHGDVEVVVADQRVVTEVVDALEGCDAVYHIAPNVSPDEVGMGEAIIAACRQVGVRRSVFHSVVAPNETAMPHHVDKGRVEALIAATDLAWTILRPNVYLQNLDPYLDDIVAGTYAVPYGSARGLAMVDLRDVAEVAAGCFRGPAAATSIGARWELSGPELVTPDDVARVASQLTGRRVVATRRSLSGWVEEATDAGMDEETRRRLVMMFAHYDRAGSDGDAQTLRRLLGREPTGLMDYLAEALTRPAKDEARLLGEETRSSTDPTSGTVTIEEPPSGSAIG